MISVLFLIVFFFFQAEDGIRDWSVTGVQTCALPICNSAPTVASSESVYAVASTQMRTRIVGRTQSLICTEIPPSLFGPVSFDAAGPRPPADLGPSGQLRSSADRTILQGSCRARTSDASAPSNGPRSSSPCCSPDAI